MGFSNVDFVFVLLKDFVALFLVKINVPEVGQRLFKAHHRRLTLKGLEVLRFLRCFRGFPSSTTGDF